MKSCLVCDIEFEVRSKFHRNQKYCCRRCCCNAQHRKQRGLSLKLLLLTCEVCDKNFEQKRANNTSYCSPRCKKLGVSRKFKGLPIKGPPKHIWGTGYVTKDGYKMVSKNHPNAKCRSKKSGKGQIFEHTYIMSKHLGRPLRKGESVHHKNGIRDDNRLENLELWVNTIRFGQRLEDKVKHYKEFLELYGYDVITKKDNKRLLGGHDGKTY